MKTLLKLALLLLPMTVLAQAPQVPMNGNIGSNFNGPLINSPAVIFTSDADHTMVYPEMSGDAGPLIVPSSVTLTATRNLFVPNTGNFTWPVKNMTTGGQTINVLVSGGTSVPVANGMTVTVVCDGTNCTTGPQGTVTSVTATAPVDCTTTGSSVNCLMAQATSSVDGYLSHVDWVTFNGKQAALGAVQQGVIGLSTSNAQFPSSLTATTSAGVTNGGYGAVFPAVPGYVNGAEIYSMESGGATVWDRLGTVFSGIPGVDGTPGSAYFGVAEASPLYSTHSQLLGLPSSTPVHHLFFSCGTIGANQCYGESQTGVPGTWVRMPGFLLGGAAGRGNCVYENAGTVYLFVNTAFTSLNLWEAPSTNMTAFTLVASNVLPRTTENISASVANCAVKIGQDGLLHLAYEARWGSAPFQIGTATSADGGLTFTKNANNPVINWESVGGPDFNQDASGNWWMWVHGNGLPTDGQRFFSPDFVTWTQNPNQLTLPRLTADEGVGLPVGQVADQAHDTDATNTFMFYSASPNGGATVVSSIKVAEAVGMTPNDVVATDETDPFTGCLSLGNRGTMQPANAYGEGSGGSNSWCTDGLDVYFESLSGLHYFGNTTYPYKGMAVGSWPGPIVAAPTSITADSINNAIITTKGAVITYRSNVSDPANIIDYLQGNGNDSRYGNLSFRPTDAIGWGVYNVDEPVGTPSTSGGTVAASTTNFAYVTCTDSRGNLSFQTAGVNQSANVVTTGESSSISWAFTAQTGCNTYYIWPATSGTPVYYYSSASSPYVQTTPASSGTSGTMPVSNTTEEASDTASVAGTRYIDSVAGTVFRNSSTGTAVPVAGVDLAGDFYTLTGAYKANGEIITPTNLVGYSSDGGGASSSPTIAIATGRPANGCATWSSGQVGSTGAGCGGGSGSVTSVTFTGDGVVDSSTPSSAVTTTGTVTATLNTQAAHTVLGNFTAGVAAPTFTAAPTFSAANLTNFPTFNQNTSGTASNLSGTPALPNGTTATTQSQADASTKLATTAYVDTGLGTKMTIPVAWSQTTPVPTCVTGSPVTLTSTLRVSLSGKTANFNLQILDTSIGTCSGNIQVVLPFTPKSYASIPCDEWGVTGASTYQLQVQAGNTTVYLTTSTGTFPGITGYSFACNGTLETQ